MRTRKQMSDHGCPALDNPQYCCRLCGKLLPNSRAYFHPECLQKDKRRRTQERRRLEKEQLLGLLRKVRCQHCGKIPVRDDSSMPIKGLKKGSVKLHKGLSGGA